MPLCSHLAKILCTPLFSRLIVAAEVGYLLALAIAQEEEEEPNDTKTFPSCMVKKTHDEIEYNTQLRLPGRLS